MFSIFDEREEGERRTVSRFTIFLVHEKWQENDPNRGHTFGLAAV